jgi:hypothetical protein
MTISVAGYILILILTLDLLGVSVQHLLLGGPSSVWCWASPPSRSWPTSSPG